MAQLPDMIGGFPKERPLWFLRDYLAQELDFLVSSVRQDIAALGNPDPHVDDEIVLEIHALMSGGERKLSIDSIKSSAAEVSTLAESFGEAAVDHIREKSEYIKSISMLLAMIAKSDIVGVLAFLKQEIADREIMQSILDKTIVSPLLGLTPNQKILHRGDIELLSLIVRLIEAGHSKP